MSGSKAQHQDQHDDGDAPCSLVERRGNSLPHQFRFNRGGALFLLLASGRMDVNHSSCVCGGGIGLAVRFLHERCLGGGEDMNGITEWAGEGGSSTGWKDAGRSV